MHQICRDPWPGKWPVKQSRNWRRLRGLVLIKIRIPQINSNRSHVAHNMAVAMANRLGAEIFFVNEANINAIRGRRDWIYDDDIKSAIRVIKQQGQNRGFSNIGIFTCYLSGNNEMHKWYRTYNYWWLMPSPQSEHWDSVMRGHLFIEWISANKYVVNNKREKPKFIHQSYGSILEKPQPCKRITHRKLRK